MQLANQIRVYGKPGDVGSRKGPADRHQTFYNCFEAGDEEEPIYGRTCKKVKSKSKRASETKSGPGTVRFEV